MCSARAAGSDCACCRIDCMTGSCMIPMISGSLISLSRVCSSHKKLQGFTAATSKLVQTSGRLRAGRRRKEEEDQEGYRSSMARGRVRLRRIENPVHRQVTFCKRRAGLLKKARELSVLCDADIGIIVFSADGKLYDLATAGTVQELIERYKSASGEGMLVDGCGDRRMDPKQEAMVLKQEINLLQKGLRYIYGNRANEHMTVEELNALERYLEIWMYNIRSAKMQTMIQEIQTLQSKEGMLKAANEILQEKILVEQNGLIDVGMMVADQQNGNFSTVPLIQEITNPLTILSGYSTCRGSEMGYSF